MTTLTEIQRLNAKFESFAFDLGDGDDGNFLSGWQCYNPFVSDFLESVRAKALTFDHRRYAYFDAHMDLIDCILSYHTKNDLRSPESVVCGGGTTALLSTFAAYLKSIGVTTVYYIPPIYITLMTALDRYGIKMVAVTNKQPYEEGFSINLPDVKGSFLLLTDPIWYAGVSIEKRFVDQIKTWQKSTQSLIFVDGSFQYMPWNGKLDEATSGLDPSLTIRLVCPAKQLCVHGYRFSYLLAPSNLSRQLNWTYTSLIGPAPIDSIAFAQQAMDSISNGDISNNIMALVVDRYRQILDSNIISSSLNPNCGYFVFAKILKELPSNYNLIDGSYFSQELYPDYVKINLLSPSFNLISR